jgi:ComF family protein
MIRLRHAWHALLDRLTPDSCAACQGILPHPSALFCSACTAEAQLETRHQTLANLEAWSACTYAGPVATAIARFKFTRHPELARRFARLIVQHLGNAGACPLLNSAALLVPVPLHPARLAERGYNQAALLARELSQLTGHPLAARALLRHTNTVQQSQLGRQARLLNLQGQFSARYSLSGKQVILIDDVLTTGATTQACAAAVQSAAGCVLGVVTFAVTGSSTSANSQHATSPHALSEPATSDRRTALPH